jgi:acylphosphatase
MPRRSVHILVEGLVQGVGFRTWVKARATALDLDGWVRNRRTGAVEAVFAGQPDAVDKMLAECRRGPSAAMVARLEVIGEGPDDARGFEVRPTV